MRTSTKRWEGWFTDPFERHELRWMSQGTPTSLVRDRDIEASDPVASGPFKVNPVRVEDHPSRFDMSWAMPIRTVDGTVDMPIVRNRFSIHAEHPEYASKIMRSTLSGANGNVVEDAAHLTSELVAEAMLHRCANPELYVDTMEDHIHVEVRDFDMISEDVDRVKLRASLLLMMNALTASWGVKPRDNCGVVWFDLSF
jgi:hypothetical protein